MIRKILAAAFLVGLCLVVLGPVCAEAPSETLLDAGKQSYSDGRYSQAIERLSSAAKEFQKFGVSDLRLADALRYLGLSYCCVHKFAEAESPMKQALAINQKIHGAVNEDVQNSVIEIAQMYAAQGKLAQSETYFRQALTIAEKGSGVDSPDIIPFMDNVAGILMAEKKLADVEAIRKRAVAICEKLADGDPRLGVALFDLGVTYSREHKGTEMEATFKRAIPICENTLPLHANTLVPMLTVLGGYYLDQNKYDQAETTLLRAKMFSEKAISPDSPVTGGILRYLSATYMVWGKYSQSEDFMKQAIAIHEKVEGKPNTALISDLDLYAQLLKKMGRMDDAAKIEERVKGLKGG